MLRSIQDCYVHENVTVQQSLFIIYVQILVHFINLVEVSRDPTTSDLPRGAGEESLLVDFVINRPSVPLQTSREIQLFSASVLSTDDGARAIRNNIIPCFTKQKSISLI